MSNVPLTLDMVGPGILWLLTIIGSCFATWRYFRGEVREVEKQVIDLRKDFSEYKVYAEKTFGTKDEQRDQTDRLMQALNTLQSSVESLGQSLSLRIDSLFHSPPPPVRRSRGNQE